MSSSDSFTTRFLPEGIPEYNALLDTHLKQHRKYLLGSKTNLNLLKKTGAIAKVEKGTSNDQYVVYLESPKVKKQIPTKKQQGIPRQEKKKTLKSALYGIERSPMRSASAGELRKQHKVEPMLEPREVTQLNTPTKPLVRHRSASALGSKSHSKDSRPIVNRLLENDLAYQEKIVALQRNIGSLDTEKKVIEQEIDLMRKQLRGVHAVQENDQAVAHCLSVVQHRFNKAEEEYMKAVIHQSNLRTSIDYLRQELLSLHQVQRKLELDIEDACAKTIQAEERIATTKATSNETAGELADLERQAEADSVERVLKLPPEDDFVHMDVPRMMAMIHERAASREEALRNMIANAAAAKAKKEADDPGELPLKHKNTFDTIQAELDVANVEAFANDFIDTENQLISLYKHESELQAEAKRFDDALAVLEEEAKRVHGVHEAETETDAAERDEYVEKIQQVERKTAEYTELARKRSVEHEALRQPILHLLEVIKADKNFLHNNGYIDVVQEMALPVILGIAQERIVEIAILSQMRRKQAKNNVTKELRPSLNRSKLRISVRRLAGHSIHAIVVGPRVPFSSNGAQINSPLGSFDELSDATVLPPELSTDAAIDNSIPVSPDQLFHRALHH
ncbi:hypothetical protein THRCLA_09053 [Thraustotheca clavata]|uniref:ODAD1 central coiled coil region domain-containing protein n=1 Tax=Thraustotheca clavata TaxID=74557 RepID=A0A1V9YZY4_9STRA|nr:hypothetical protein THRCLA_09053 [Thraustotheca clavata]